MNLLTERNCQLANAIQKIDDHMFLAAEFRAWYELYVESNNKRCMLVSELLSARLAEVIYSRIAGE